MMVRGQCCHRDQLCKDLSIAYASRSFNKVERNYSTVEKELAAIVWQIKHFRPYLYGRKFKIVSDHKPLIWILSVKDPGSRLSKWRMKLEKYDYEIVVLFKYLFKIQMRMHSLELVHSLKKAVILMK